MTIYGPMVIANDECSFPPIVYLSTDNSFRTDAHHVMHGLRSNRVHIRCNQSRRISSWRILRTDNHVILSHLNRYKYRFGSTGTDDESTDAQKALLFI